MTEEMEEFIGFLEGTVIYEQLRQPTEIEFSRLQVVSNVNIETLSEETFMVQYHGKEIRSPDLELQLPCRVCLEEKNVKDLNSIFSENQQYENVPFILKTLLDIEVTSAVEQPVQICELCFNTLTNFFNFYRKVKIAQYKYEDTISEKHTYQENPLNTLPSDHPVTVKLPKLPNRRLSSELMVKEAKNTLTNSPFSYFVKREISDEKWKHIYTVMASALGNGSNKLKVLDDYILDDPFAGNWQCIVCKENVSGGRAEFIDHAIQNHDVWNAEQVMFPCDVCGLAFPLVGSTGSNESYCEHWLKHFFPKECAVCKLKLVSGTALKRHKEAIHGEGIFECDQCEKVFVASSKLKIHKNNVHAPPEVKRNKKRVHWCQLCKKNVSNSTAHKLHNHSNDTPWKCQDCEKKFKTFSHLKAHRTSMHSEIKLPFKCKICDEAFTSSSTRSRHFYSVHSTQKFFCDICDTSFGLPRELKVHVTSHLTCGEAHCVCEVCGKSFKGEGHLKEHMHIHNDEKPFECPICAVKIRMKSNLWKHIKSVHKTTMKAYKESITNNSCATMESRNIISSEQAVCTEEVEKTLRCDDCWKSFESIEILQVHRDLVHLGLKIERVQVWKCEDCEDTFDSAIAKRKHIEEKHGENIHFGTACILCNKNFSDEQKYKRHLGRIHNRSEAEKFPCQYCHVTFDSVVPRKKHIEEKHKEEMEVSATCVLCNKRYPNLRAYKQHMKLHNANESGKSPCEICGKTCKNKVQLQKCSHPYNQLSTLVPCPLCKYKFRRDDLVRMHMRNTHKVTMTEYRKTLVASAESISKIENE